MNIDDKIILKLVEDTAATRQATEHLKEDRERDKLERAKRQTHLDERLKEIQQHSYDTRQKLDEHLTVWKTTKRVFIAIISVLIGIITLDWQSIVDNWAKLWN